MLLIIWYVIVSLCGVGIHYFGPNTISPRTVLRCFLWPIRKLGPVLGSLIFAGMVLFLIVGD
jgi:hypothetical protein